MSNANNLVGNLSAEAQMAWRLNLFAIKTQEHLAKRAKEEEETVLREAQDIENLKIMDAILAENERNRIAEENRQRIAANQNLEADLERRFFAANPAATIGNWQNAKSEILKNYFVNRMEAEATTEDLMRQTGNYGAM